MTRLIGAEVFKMRTTRTFYGLVVSALALVLLIVILGSALSDANDASVRDAIQISFFARVMALLLGIIAVTSEFRFGTITPSLLVVPDRARLTLAKLGAALLVGLALGLLSTVLCAVVGYLILSARDVSDPLATSDAIKMIIGGTVAVALYAALGVGVGAIVRNQVGAVVGVLVWLFVLEPLLQIIKPLRDPLAKYGFGGVGDGLTGATGANADHPPLHQIPAGLLLTAYCAILLVIGIMLMRKRDITA